MRNSICAADSVGSGLNITVGICRSGSSKVDDFGTNQKCTCDFLLVRHSNLRHVLHRF